MKDTIRARILRELLRQGRIDNPHELQQAARTDTHNVVHVVLSMTRQGLVTSKRRRISNRDQVPTKIEITDRGIRELER